MARPTESRFRHLYICRYDGVEVPAPPMLEILGLRLNGSTQLSVTPRDVLTAELDVRVNTDAYFDDALIMFGKAYDRGTEPQPLPCPEGTEGHCTPTDLGYYYVNDKAFLPLPVFGTMDWWYEWYWLIIYWNGYSELLGNIGPWYYSSGNNTFPRSVGFSLTPGEYTLLFPRPDLSPSQFQHEVRVSDTIRGTVDAMVLINSDWDVFKEILTIGVSPYNPDQLTVEQWIEKARQPEYHYWY